MFITPMSDSTSERRREERRSGGQKDFSQILTEQTRKLQEERSMEGKTVGYGRNGIAYIGQAMSRTYNQSKNEERPGVRGHRGHYEEIYQYTRE